MAASKAVSTAKDSAKLKTTRLLRLAVSIARQTPARRAAACGGEGGFTGVKGG
jgi:hypothetical protein